MNVEPIPSLFQDIIERMVSSQVMTVKPDCCIVDFYNEGLGFDGGTGGSSLLVGSLGLGWLGLGLG